MQDITSEIPSLQSNNCTEEIIINCPQTQQQQQFKQQSNNKQHIYQQNTTATTKTGGSKYTAAKTAATVTTPLQETFGDKSFFNAIPPPLRSLQNVCKLQQQQQQQQQPYQQQNQKYITRSQSQQHHSSTNNNCSTSTHHLNQLKQQQSLPTPLHQHSGSNGLNHGASSPHQHPHSKSVSILVYKTLNTVFKSSRKIIVRVCEVASVKKNFNMFKFNKAAQQNRADARANACTGHDQFVRPPVSEK